MAIDVYVGVSEVVDCFESEQNVKPVDEPIHLLAMVFYSLRKQVLDPINQVDINSKDKPI